MAGQGIGYLKRATQLLPEAAEIQYDLLLSQAELGNNEAAKENLDSVLSGAPPADTSEGMQNGSSSRSDALVAE